MGKALSEKAPKTSQKNPSRGTQSEDPAAIAKAKRDRAAKRKRASFRKSEHATFKEKAKRGRARRRKSVHKSQSSLRSSASMKKSMRKSATKKDAPQGETMNKTDPARHAQRKVVPKEEIGAQKDASKGKKGSKKSSAKSPAGKKGGAAKKKGGTAKKPAAKKPADGGAQPKRRRRTKQSGKAANGTAKKKGGAKQTGDAPKRRRRTKQADAVDDTPSNVSNANYVPLGRSAQFGAQPALQRRFVKRGDGDSGSGSLYELVRVASPTPSYSYYDGERISYSSSGGPPETDFEEFEPDRRKPNYDTDYAGFDQARGDKAAGPGDFADYQAPNKSAAPAKKDKAKKKGGKKGGKEKGEDYAGDFADYNPREDPDAGETDWQPFQRSEKAGDKERYRSDFAEFSDSTAEKYQSVKAQKSKKKAPESDDGWNQYAPDYARYIPKRQKYRVRKRPRKDDESSTSSDRDRDMEARFRALAYKFQKLNDAVGNALDNADEKADVYEMEIEALEQRLADMQQEAQTRIEVEYSPSYSYTYDYVTYSYSYSDYEEPRRRPRRERRTGRRERDRRMAVVIRDAAREKRGETSRSSIRRQAGGGGGDAANKDVEARFRELQKKLSTIQDKLTTTDAEYREQAGYFDHRLKDADTRAKKVEKKLKELQDTA